MYYREVGNILFVGVITVLKLGLRQVRQCVGYLERDAILWHCMISFEDVSEISYENYQIIRNKTSDVIIINFVKLQHSH